MSIPTFFEYLSPVHATAIYKLASAVDEEREQTRRMPKAMGKVFGKILKNQAAFGVGLAAGVGTGLLANAGYKKVTGQPVPPALAAGLAIPVAALAAKMYDRYKVEELKELQREFYQTTRNRGAGSVPGK